MRWRLGSLPAMRVNVPGRVPWLNLRSESIRRRSVDLCRRSRSTSVSSVVTAEQSASSIRFGKVTRSRTPSMLMAGYKSPVQPPTILQGTLSFKMRRSRIDPKISDKRPVQRRNAASSVKSSWSVVLDIQSQAPEWLQEMFPPFFEDFIVSCTKDLVCHVTYGQAIELGVRFLHSCHKHIDLMVTLSLPLYISIRAGHRRRKQSLHNCKLPFRSARPKCQRDLPHVTTALE
jgi:hypothetical protein